MGTPEMGAGRAVHRGEGGEYRVPTRFGWRSVDGWRPRGGLLPVRFCTTKPRKRSLRWSRVYDRNGPYPAVSSLTVEPRTRRSRSRTHGVVLQPQVVA